MRSNAAAPGSRQNQDRHRIAGRAQFLDDGQPVDLPRQHAVDNHHVVPTLGGQGQAVAAIPSSVEDMALLRQALADKRCQPLVIFHQEKFHLPNDGYGHLRWEVVFRGGNAVIITIFDCIKDISTRSSEPCGGAFDPVYSPPPGGPIGLPHNIF